MRYRLKNQTEVDAAAAYLSTLAGREATVDIRRVPDKRSIQANKYYHVMLSYFGAQVGHTLDEVKQLIRELQPTPYNLRYTTVAGVRIQASRSSAEFTSKEMADSIDQFRRWAREVADVDIAAPDDIQLLRFMDDYIAQNESYL